MDKYYYKVNIKIWLKIKNFEILLIKRKKSKSKKMIKMSENNQKNKL